MHTSYTSCIPCHRIYILDGTTTVLTIVLYDIYIASMLTTACIL